MVSLHFSVHPVYVFDASLCWAEETKAPMLNGGVSTVNGMDPPIQGVTAVNGKDIAV